MKKVLFLLAMMVIVGCAQAYNFSAVAPSGQTLFFSINTVENTVTVTFPNSYIEYLPSYHEYYYYNYPMPSGALTIPSTVNNGGNTYRVTKIGNHAFYECTGITSITIPNSVTMIDQYAFAKCSGLCSLNTGDSTASIGNGAFLNCSSLTTITIGKNIQSMNGAFQGCTNISTVNYNAINLTSGWGIPNSQGVTLLNIGSEVQTIPNNAFSQFNITTVSIPNSITNIGAGAFYGCTILTSVNIPNSVVSIGNAAFYNTGITSITLPNSITNISDALFQQCTNLSSVSLPNTIISIGNSAFQGCTSLTSFTIPTSVVSIGDMIFSGCTNLIELVFNADSCTSMGGCNYGSGGYHYALENCPDLTNIVIGNNVTNIPANAFRNCNGLTSISIPSSVRNIGQASFYGLTGLTSVNFSEGLENIGEQAFYGCTGLSAVTIPNSVSTIGNSAFEYCTGIQAITLGDFLTSIGISSFGGCTGLTSITIPSMVSNIGGTAFSGCSNLTNVVSLAETPPTLGVNAINSSITVSIPCATYEAYHSSWGNYNFQEPLSNINITLASNNTLWGETSVIQRAPMYTTVRCDSTAVIQATANYGYHFDHWSTGSTQSLDTVHLTGDCTITAYFAKNQYIVTALTNQNDRGSVTGSATVDYLDNVTLTATANYGYHFSRWSDGSTDNPHQVTATQNMTVYAYFEPNQYSLNVLSADGTMGNVSGSGNFDYLSNRTITARANYGYHFVQWNDGMATSSRTITITQDTSFTAYFAVNQYTLTVVSADEAMGSVSGGGTFDYGNMVTISANPTEHYHFVRWNDGNTDNPRDIEITQDRTLTAFFAIDTHHVEVNSGDITRGSVTGGGDFEYGTAITVSASAYSGYQFVRWSNGVSYNPYTFAVTTDMELTAVFIEEGTVYNISVTANDPAAGTVSGGGPYGVGEEAVLTAIANSGYQFDHWEDGSYQNPRTVTVTADASYVAYFVPTQSISDVQDVEALIYARGGRIIVKNVNGMVVRVYDMMGRLVATASGETVSVPMPVGVYLVKVGTLPARKVVVIR